MTALPLMSVADSQKYLGLKRYQFDNLVRPHVPEIRIGRRIFFSRHDLDSFVENRKGAKKESKKRVKDAGDQPGKAIRWILNMS